MTHLVPHRGIAALAALMLAAGSMSGCGALARGAAQGAAKASAAELAEQAAAKVPAVRGFVENFDGDAARAAARETDDLARQSEAAAATENTAEARAAAERAKQSANKAKTEVDTGLLDDALKELEKKIKEQIRDMLRSAACDAIDQMLATHLPVDSPRYAALVEIYIRSSNLSVQNLTTVIDTATANLKALFTYNPTSTADLALLADLAKDAYCTTVREADKPQNKGWGVNLNPQAVPIWAVNGTTPLGYVQPRQFVKILCTRRLSTVNNSNLWDKVSSTGYVADANLFTGTNDPVAPTCLS